MKKKEHDLKVRFLERLEAEGCLNEVLFDRPHWDDDGKHDIKDHGLENLVKMIPHDVVVWAFEDK